MQKKCSKYFCFIFNKTSLKLFTLTMLCLLITNFVCVDKKVQAVTSSTSVSNINIVCSSTAYTGGGATCTGISCVRKPFGLSTIAVDPRVIPLGSLVYVENYGKAIAADTGGAIKGNIVDVFLNSKSECISWGRKYNVPVYILAYPGEW